LNRPGREKAQRKPRRRRHPSDPFDQPFEPEGREGIIMTTGLSKDEKRALRSGHIPTTAPAPLLLTRRQTQQVLGGISLSTILRLEKEGALRKIRLGRGGAAQVFHSMENVRALVAQRAAEAEADAR
jgi:hypothetical protein